MTEYKIQVSPEVAGALRSGLPVVALESTIVSHGLPRPDNLRVALEIERTVREAGAVPATIGMLDGAVTVGVTGDQLARLASAPDVVKLSVRDLAPAAATGRDGATTVAATSAIAGAVGIRVFATGGLGGVHREAATTFDESADLVTLAHTPIVVVCAGVKSILDTAATLQRLETLGVTVVGYRTRRFPGFFVSDSGEPVEWCADDAGQIARMVRAQQAYGLHRGALLVANPLPPDEQLDPDLHDRVLAEGLAGAAAAGIRGKAVTPYLLAHFHSATGGRSLEVNVRIILRNAALAASIAVALARRAAGSRTPA